MEAARNLDSLWLPEYEEKAEGPLSIVGETSDGHMTIFLGDDGRVYLAASEEFTCIGDDVGDGLNSLFAGPSYDVERARRHLPRSR